MSRTMHRFLDAYRHADLTERLYLYLQYPELRIGFTRIEQSEAASGLKGAPLANTLCTKNGGFSMNVEAQISLLEEILKDWKEIIGSEYAGYRNHVYRMVHFCLALKDCTQEEREKIIIAGAFHDIGIWVEDTIDYIPSSIPPAMAYLKIRNLEAWSNEIELMITEHHKIRAYKNEKYPLVELFRKGDLVDFSFGLFKFGIPKSYIERVKAEFPNSGFHKNLRKRAARWCIRHPLNPVPMMKW